jgi:hypothetical protein
VEGHPQAEIARRTGVKEGTVWSRLAQARKLVQKRLARRGAALRVNAQAARPQETAPEPPPAAGGAKAPPAAPQGEDVEVSGQVLGADGKPFAGARLLVWTRAVKKKEDLPTRATTGEDGRFRFSVALADLSRGASVAATAKRHGPDWAALPPGKVGAAN